MTLERNMHAMIVVFHVENVLTKVAGIYKLVAF